MPIKFARQDYMEKKCSHQEYYEQFCSNVRFNPEFEERIKKSTDEHFNDIALVEWDSARADIDWNLFLEAGCGQSLSNKVCALKAKARQIRGW